MDVGATIVLFGETASHLKHMPMQKNSRATCGSGTTGWRLDLGWYKPAAAQDFEVFFSLYSRVYLLISFFFFTLKEPVLLCMSGKPVIGDPESLGSPASGLWRPGLFGQCPWGNWQSPVAHILHARLRQRRAGLSVHHTWVGQAHGRSTHDKPLLHEQWRSGVLANLQWRRGCTAGSEVWDCCLKEYLCYTKWHI